MPTQTFDIDPELTAPLAAIPKIDLSDISATREFARNAAAQMAATFPPEPSISVDTIEIPRSPEPPVPVRIFRPTESAPLQPCLLWFFAGGQVMGGAGEDDAYISALAKQLGCVVAVVDYRLAPEAPAPAAAEDGYLAYSHLRAHAHELGLDAERIGIAGASGGGAIAAATMLLIRDRRATTPRVLALNYPMLDDRNRTPSSHEVTDVGIFDRATNLTAWSAVLGERAGADNVDPVCAPGRATDLTGFPPTFIAAAEIDVFRDEDLAFAQQLIADHVPTELHLYAGAYHAFDRFAPQARVTKSFEASRNDFLARYL
jgi:acetyl esterase/lipase